MSAENLNQLRNLVGVTWVRPPYFSIHQLAVELSKRADTDLTDDELRAASGAVRAIVEVAAQLAPEAERDPAVRADEHREFARMLLALLGSATGRKHLAAFAERVREAAKTRREAAEARRRAEEARQAAMRDAQMRAEAAALPIDRIIAEIEQAGFGLAVNPEGKLLAPKSLPMLHRIRIEVRKNEIIQFLKRRAEMATATEEV